SIGKNHALGEVSVALGDLASPGAYRLVVGLEGLPVENDWKFWLYPETGDNGNAAEAAEEAGAADAAVADFLVTSRWPDAQARDGWPGVVWAAAGGTRPGDVAAEEARPGILEHPEDGPAATGLAAAIRRDARPGDRRNAAGAGGFPDGGTLRFPVDAADRQ